MIIYELLNMYRNTTLGRKTASSWAPATRGARLEYLSLAEIDYKKIKAIFKHEIVPGQRLTHEELMLRLKTSQTPIREPLSRLA